MQDYKNFITEINTVDVQTKQMFVKDGIIQYDAPVNVYLEKDPNGERWPGHLSTFYNFDKYNADNETHLYERELTTLRDLALVDLLSLPSEQLNRFLSDLRAKRDRMSRLAKVASELHKEYLYQKFEEALSLKYNLFESFTIPQHLNVSLDLYSARYLWQAVTAKRGELIVIVKQIEQAISPEPQEVFNAESETEEGKNKPLLFIRPESRQALYNELKRYLSPDPNGEYQDLHNLIFNNIAPDSPIIFTALVKEFGLTFTSTNAVLDRGGEALSHQLIGHFVRNDGRNIVPLSHSNLVKYLNGKRT